MSEEELVAAAREASRAERAVVSRHARMRMKERGLEKWQLWGIVENGRVASVDADGVPNPTVNFEGELADGAATVAVVAYRLPPGLAVIVTAYVAD